MKIGFIGAGNMAQAIIQGLLKKKVIETQNILITSGHFENAKKIADELNITACQTNSEAAEKSDILILAVKPNILPIVLPEISNEVQKSKPLLVSIAAGMSLKKLAALINLDDISICRVMPNVNVSIEAGVSAICRNDYVNDEQQRAVVQLFEAVGSVYPLEEKDFSAFVGLAGSSPAYVYMFIDAISRAGVLNGIPKDKATEIATKAVLGSAKRLLAGNEKPWDLVDQVSSPGGTTIEGVVALEKNGFISAVIQGIDATIKKDQSM